MHYVKSKDQVNATRLIKEIETLVEDAERWLKALIADLKATERLAA